MHFTSFGGTSSIPRPASSYLRALCKHKPKLVLLGISEETAPPCGCMRSAQFHEVEIREMLVV